jgi:hypothetical protein
MKCRQRVYGVSLLQLYRNRDDKTAGGIYLQHGRESVSHPHPPLLEQSAKANCNSYTSLCIANKVLLLNGMDPAMHRGKVARQVKVLIKNLAIFFLFPSKKFLPMLGADKLVTTQIWKLKNFMSLFSDVFSFPVQYLLEKDLKNVSERNLSI